jgi:hypothetical protein
MTGSNCSALTNPPLSLSDCEINLDEESGELSPPMTGNNCSALTNLPLSLLDCEMNLDEESGELSPPMTRQQLFCPN